MDYELSTDFTFDLHLNFSDALFLLCYVVLMCPFLLAARLVKALGGKNRRHTIKDMPRFADGKIYLFPSFF